jgi:hypothetical protein
MDGGKFRSCVVSDEKVEIARKDMGRDAMNDGSKE